MHPAQIASEVPYTGFTTLVVFADGSWLSPADSARITEDRRTETGRFSWGQDECGDWCYTNLPALRRKHFAGSVENAD
jgi:hypothetical protein